MTESTIGSPDSPEATALYQTMSTLRAVRRLRTDPIPDDVLERVVQAACWAPTGGNRQPWRIVVVRSPQKKQELAGIYQPEWERYSEGLRRQVAALEEPAKTKLARTAAAGDYLAEHLGEAPAILVFCANPKEMAITDIKLDRVSMVGGGSVYPAVQNVMLACVAEGLGCTLTTLHCLQEDRVKDVLDVPDDWATVALVPIGYPVGRGHGPISRQAPAALAFADTFGTPWPKAGEVTEQG